MLSDAVEFLLNDGNAHFDWNDISMDHKSAVRFHSEIVARTYAPRRVLP
jgi:hypothetical protein